jgi:hypothetical protein
MRRLAIAALSLGLPALAFGQIPTLSDIAKKLTTRIPGLDAVLEAEPALTTSVADANGEVPMMDGFDPPAFEPLDGLPRDEVGAFVLRPGAFALDAQSYCLHAGTYGPTRGDGYVFAELAGPRADVVQSVLDRVADNPDIEQPDVQMLLWAILSRTKVDEMGEELQSVAGRLLSDAQIDQLNGGALAHIPAGLREQAFASVPDAVRRSLEVEAELRDRLTDGQSTYEELEAVAVLDGEPEWTENDREVPWGRWSLHPGGFFVRYLPDGYTETRIEVYVPEPVTIVRDALGRIVRMSDRAGRVTETEYDDGIAPLEVPDDPRLKGYAFRTIRFVEPDPDGGEPLVAEWRNQGWTFVSVPDAGAATAARAFFLRPAVWRGRRPDNPYEDWVKRYEKAKGYYDDAKAMNERWQRIRSGKRTWADIQRVADIKHYQDGLQAALGGDLTEKGKWIQEHSERTIFAWQYAISELGGGSDGGSTYRPSRDVATPGSSGAQRLGLSGRGF